MLTVPEKLTRVTISREGEAGREWLRQVPGLVDHYLHLWELTIDGAPLSGAVGIVVPVLQDREPAALKISFPHPGNVAEPVALAAFAGRGAVRLLSSDETAFAMLMERAGPETLASVPSTDEGLEIAGNLARRLAVPAPDQLPPLGGQDDKWLEMFDHDASSTDHGLSADAIDRARRTISTIPPESTMMHGDLHFGNVLQAHREPWLAIDPRGWAGPLEFESYTLACERPAEIRASADPLAEVRRRVALFCRAASGNIDLALAFCQARAASSAFYERSHDAVPENVAMLELVAERL